MQDVGEPPSPPSAAGHPSPPAASHPPPATRRRTGLLVGGGLLLLVALVAVERAVVVRPEVAQRVVISRGGTVLSVLGPGQTGYLNPWTESRRVYDTALLSADRSGGNRGMTALTAEGHAVTVFGTAFWREGDEADTRWRFEHVRDRPEAMQSLMAASVQVVLGRRGMEEAVRDGDALQLALTEDLRTRARALLRVDVAGFVLTGIEPGESYQQVVTERELGRARAASVAASPALSTGSPYALEVERIRRWDGRGVMPDLSGRGAAASGDPVTR